MLPKVTCGPLPVILPKLGELEWLHREGTSLCANQLCHTVSPIKTITMNGIKLHMAYHHTFSPEVTTYYMEIPKYPEILLSANSVYQVLLSAHAREPGNEVSCMPVCFAHIKFVQEACMLLVSSPDTIFFARVLRPCQKNRVWTRSLVKLGLNHTSVVACCRTNQIAQVK